MAKREDEETRYGKWIEAIDEADKYLDDRSQEWNDFLKFYRQDLDWKKEFGDRDTIWINYQFYFSRVILPSIYYKNPDILIEARRKGDPIESMRAKVKEHLINYQLDEINFEDEARKVVFDALYAWGVMKFGYGPAMWKNPKKAVDDLLSLSLEDLFESDGETPFQPTEKPEEEVDDRITENNPFAIRVSPRFFPIDPLATGLHDARWVAHAVLKTVDEVKGSKIYPRGLTSGIEGTHRLDDFRHIPSVSSELTSSYLRGNGNNDLLLLYEIWDKVENKLIVMDSYNMGNQRGSKHKFLREEENPFDIEGFPFELLVFNHDPDVLGGVPDTRMWDSPAAAMNLINSMQYNHAKRFTRKYSCKEGSIDEVELDKLTLPVDGVIIKTKGTQSESGPWPIQDAPMTPDAYAFRETIRSEMMNITGITEAKQGSVTRAKTATEAADLAQQSQIRDSDRLYLVSRFVEKAVRKILQLDRQFLDPEYIAFVTSPEEALYWTMDSKAILQAEVDVHVKVGSSAYTSRAVKTKQLLDAFNLTAGLLDPMTGQPYIDVRKFIERIFENLDLDDYQSLIVPPMMPPAGLLPPGSPLSSPGQASAMSPQMSGGPLQPPANRGGATDMGKMLSGVQNLGVRRDLQ